MAMIEITKKDYDDVEAKMRKNIDNLQENLNTIRAGRANPHVLDKIPVDYYGAPSPLNAVANIQVPEARMITLTPLGSQDAQGDRACYPGFRPRHQSYKRR